MLRCPVILCVLCLALFARAAAGAEPAGSLAEWEAQWSETVARHAADLDQLSAECAASELSVEAKAAADWIVSAPPLTVLIPRLNVAEIALPAAGGSPVRDAWRTKFIELRVQQAERLFALARRAAELRDPARAYQGVLATVRENPDHEQARRMLGYVRHEGGWLKPFEIDKRRAGLVWHDQFGWLKAEHVARYEAGERYLSGRWVSAEEDRRAHQSDPARGWLVLTEHFGVHSCASLVSGVHVAKLLEAVYEAWLAVFVGYAAGTDDLTPWFDGQPLLKSPPGPLDVYHFRDHAHYVASLQQAQPQIGITAGYFDPRVRRSYFYGGIEDKYIAHEATHHLFSQIRPTARDVGRDSNYWITEGVACYMESLAIEPAMFALGGANGGRLPKARYALLQENYSVPLAAFVTRGQRAFQQDAQIALEYCQAAGQAHFLMHGERARYRRALIAYLTAVYADRADEATLSALGAAPYPLLDQQYRAFLKEQSAAASPPPP